MSIADQKNFLAGLLYVAVGGATAIGSLSYSIGTPRHTGPGFFPLGVGLALALVGAILAARSLTKGTVPAHDQWSWWSLKPLLIILAAVGAFGILIMPVGFFGAAIALLMICRFADKEGSWRTSLLTAVVLLPLTWVVFIVLLGLQIPLAPGILSH